MRLLQVNLRTLLLCLLILVVVSIPMSFFAIRGILNEEVDESLALHSDQFIRHIKTFEYLDDLELDLGIWDLLSYDIMITPTTDTTVGRTYQNMSLFDSVDHEFKPFRVLTMPVEIKHKHYLLITRMSLVDNDDLVIALAGVQVVIVIVLAGALLLLNRRITERIWRPFYHTLNQLKAYELDKSESIEPADTRIAEFQDLNKTVTTLTDRNRRIYMQQKEFIENASHELQTPLAIFQSKLDVLMQNASLNEDAAVIIAELEETAQRMAKLNRDLLLLSKIDNEQFAGYSQVDVSQVAKRVLDDLIAFADAGQIAIDVNLQPTTVRANTTLIEILLTNLFHNALRYTGPNGVVNVLLAGDSLTVSNVGEPLKMNSTRIFDRFSKDGTSESSTGLGLAIVKKICDFSGFRVSYSYHGNRHQFTVVFR